ncbi:hypothetical protein A7X88_06820 [Stenotrophomonas maltophilia]|nr:hypothetical protein A7X88_06820 [Stenotrophomonas maltophilia]
MAAPDASVKPKRGKRIGKVLKRINRTQRCDGSALRKYAAYQLKCSFSISQISVMGRKSTRSQGFQARLVDIKPYVFDAVARLDHLSKTSKTASEIKKVASSLRLKAGEEIGDVTIYVSVRETVIVDFHHIANLWLA